MLLPDPVQRLIVLPLKGLSLLVDLVDGFFDTVLGFFEKLFTKK